MLTVTYYTVNSCEFHRHNFVVVVIELTIMYTAVFHFCLLINYVIHKSFNDMELQRYRES